ncbi:hypothetical protein QE152_g39843 [Popillia japonica]|uniref:Retrovirus-related Pol polyprotein from transposon TNT 1-94-like beta-barrel domain-containing protein n=1 Tax=Popillia japonica TaxID=7064 RepID=A0AAW1HSV9_POPJA
MSSDRSLFKTFNTTQTEKKVKIGDGSVQEVRGIVNIELEALNVEKYIKTTLSNVLYVPDLKFNLFSVGCAVDKGYSMVTDKDKCKLVDGNGKVRVLATRYDKFYCMEFVRVPNLDTPHNCERTLQVCRDAERDMQCQPSNLDIANCHRVESIQTWHKRCTYVDLDDLGGQKPFIF